MPSVLDKRAVLYVDSPRPAGFVNLVESKLGLQLIVIVLAAAVLCLPCLLYGLPGGTNGATHVKYQHHFSAQIWNGEGYPRWLANENKGYGSPIFLIQYPLPYFVTALLRPVTSFSAPNRESRELGLFCWLTLAGAGLGAWLWLRKFTRPLAATLAAVVYMSLPYVLQDGIYARTAIGELCTFIWMPLALSLCESMYKRRSAAFVLGGVFALLIVSNLLTAVLFAPVLTLYAIWFGRQIEPSMYRRAFLVLLAQLLGAAMAGIYLLPLLAYRRLFDVHQMEGILPGYQLGLYFLSVTSSNLHTKAIVLSMGGVMLFAAAAAWYIWRAAADIRIRISMLLILILGALALIPNLGHSIIRMSGYELRPGPGSNFTATMLLGIFLTVALGFWAYCRISDSDEGERALLLVCIVGVAFFFMLPFSAPIWKAAPGSSVFQFPFRIAGILCVAVAGILSMAFDSCLKDSLVSPRSPSRSVIALAVLVAVGGGLLTWRMDRAFLHPKDTAFDATQDIDPMYRAYVPLEQLGAFAQSLGTTPETYDIEPRPGDGTLRSELVNGDCDFKVTRERPRALAVTSDCRGEARLRIGQLYSPLWKIVPVHPISQNSTINRSTDGVVELALSAGNQDVRLVFDVGRPERWGIVLSGASLLIGLFGFVYFRIRPTQISGRLAV